MAMKIKQGDAYAVPVAISFGETDLDLAEVDSVEFYIGGYRKLYPGEVLYRQEDGYFYVPITQEESFSWEENSSIALDARVKWRGGDIQGTEKQKMIGVVDAVSEEVL